MGKCYGKYLERIRSIADKNVLQLSLLPESMQFEWSFCGSLTDLIVKMYWLLADKRQISDPTSIGEANIKDSLNYIVNELLENAYKFRVPNSTIGVEISVLADDVYVQVTNEISGEQVAKLEAFINKISHSNKQRLLFDRLESESFVTASDGKSQIGLLTLICDHDATVGWLLEGKNDGSHAVNVCTQARLKIFKTKNNED
jgi:hypothetical protein